MLIFDSGTFPEIDRAEALSAAMSEIETPQTITFSASRPVQHRMEAFELGPGVHLLRNSGAPLHVVRSARHVRLGSREEAVFHVQSRGGTLITTGGGITALRPGQLGAVDVTRPYAVRQLGESENSALVVEFGRLDLPVDQIRAAIPVVGRSPLYELFREHVLRLNLDLPADAAAMTGRATAALVAALVASVCDHPRARDVLHVTEPARVAAYIDMHLADAGLTPGQVAAACGLPARRLAALWRREHGSTPADWIARRRLHRARRLLGDPSLAPATLDDIAYACGFSDTADFGRRFLAEYGAPPADFRGPPSR